MCDVHIKEGLVFMLVVSLRVKDGLVCVCLYLRVGCVYWQKFGSGQMKISGMEGLACLTQNLHNNVCLCWSLLVLSAYVCLCVLLSASFLSVCPFVFEAESCLQKWLGHPECNQSCCIESDSVISFLSWRLWPRISQNHTQTAELFLHLHRCVWEGQSAPDNSVHVKLFIRPNVDELCVFVRVCVSMTQRDSRAKKLLKRPQLHFHCNRVF